MLRNYLWWRRPAGTAPDAVVLQWSCNAVPNQHGRGQGGNSVVVPGKPDGGLQERDAEEAQDSDPEGAGDGAGDGAFQSEHNHEAGQVPPVTYTYEGLTANKVYPLAARVGALELRTAGVTYRW